MENGSPRKTRTGAKWGNPVIPDAPEVRSWISTNRHPSDTVYLYSITGVKEKGSQALGNQRRGHREYRVEHLSCRKAVLELRSDLVYERKLKEAAPPAEMSADESH